LAKDFYVSLEYGMESFNDDTLDAINRCHSAEETRSIIRASEGRGLHLGGHLVLGLPGDSQETIISFANEVNQLPLDLLKLHHLQIVTGSTMYKQYKEDPNYFTLFSVKSYCGMLLKFMEQLNPNIIMERFTAEAPADILVAPKWGLKNFEFTEKFEKYLILNNSWQGKRFEKVKSLKVVKA